MWDRIDLLLLLHWKYWILHIRRPCGMACDFIFPIVMALLLCGLRDSNLRYLESNKIYEPFCASPKPIPYLCPFNNYSNMTEEAEEPIPTRLFYSPDNPQLAKIMNIYNAFGYEVEPKRNHEVLAAAFKMHANTTMAGIQFDDSYSTTADLRNIKNLKVSIRFPAELKRGFSRWNTFELYQSDDNSEGAGPRNPKSSIGGNPNYYKEGFLCLQQILGFAFILSRDGGVDLHPSNLNESLSKISKWVETKKFPQMYMQRFPHAEWWTDPNNDILEFSFAAYVIFGFCPFFVNTVKLMVLEKERQLKEFIKIMGLPTWLYWTSWFLQSYIYLLIIMIIFLILVLVPVFADEAIFTFSNPLVISCFLLVYGAATITFAFLFSALFSRATKAAICTAIIWLMVVLVLGEVSKTTTRTQLALCLLPNFAIKIGFRTIFAFEKRGEGAQWHNLSEPISDERSTSLGLVILMLILDTLLFLFIAIYIEAIFPGEFGVRHPWNFLCRPSYWRTKQNTETEDVQPINRTRNEFLETEPTDLKAGVQIQNLTKVFGSITAVHGLNLNMYENQITVLLGHNGAGKTTTISLLSGMTAPTSGTAIINGYDIRRDRSLIRHCMGICPQHNILYDGLTVREHLYFYSRIKRMSRKEAKAEVNRYLVSMELSHKKDVPARQLSGGLKRKLSVCIALCGNSKIVMLDEPTTGLDPNNRRKLWDLLLKHKTGKTILLTTHFMDEADVLGDRVAIMAEGELKCCGTSFFLKKKFGSGYILIVDKGPRCDVPKITSLLKSFVPEVQLTANTDTEVTYSLPEDRISSFEAMLKQLEDQSSNIGVRSYGISLSTMEAVFMKAGTIQSHDTSTSQNVSLMSSNVKPTNAKGIRLIGNQVIAMLWKRIKSFKRSPIQWAIHFLLVPLSVLTSIRSSAKHDEFQLPAFPLSLSKYDNPITMMENLGELEGYFDSYKGLVQDEKYEVEYADIVDKSLKMTKKKLATFNRRYIIGASFNSKNGKPIIGAWFNNHLLHSQPLALVYAQSAVFRRMSNCNSCSFEFTNEPFPYSDESKKRMIQGSLTDGMALLDNLLAPLTFVAACFILFPIKERACNSRHLQFVAGVKIFILWLTTFLFDFVIFTLICLLPTIIIVCLQIDGCKTAADIGRIWVLLLLYGWAFLPLLYVAAFLFSVPASGYIVVFIVFYFLGVLLSMLLNMMSTNSDSHASLILLLLSPLYCLGNGLSKTQKFYGYKKMCEDRIKMCTIAGYSENQCVIDAMCEEYNDSYYRFGGQGIGYNMLYLFITGLVCFFLLFLIEYHIITRVMTWIVSKIWRRRPVVESDEDSDVSEERRRISDMSIEELKTSHEVAVKNLTKYYCSLRAVNGLCLGVKKNECFGLLGVNGAGKTTTFKMMTGDVRMTYGQGWVQGHSLNQIRKVHRCIGYCPQFDALLDDMTARETLIMFALIKGYRYSDAKSLAETFSENLDFRKHLDKEFRKMSGGNKRKLSAAVAMIGDPPVLYLDEPTSGMDPATKYYFRELVRKLRDTGKCIILTSHSLEECESLCTRLVIMADGSFKCLGSVQHLKSKFAKGCTFIIKIKRDTSESGINLIQKYVKDNLPLAQLSEKHEEMLTYKMIGTEVPWSKIFGILATGKRNIKDIEHFSLAQGSLEQVFLSFSKQQRRD